MTIPSRLGALSHGFVDSAAGPALTGSLLGAANAGHFAIDPDKAQRMLTVIAECREDLEALTNSLHRLMTHEPPLGDLHEARATAAFDVRVATGDPRSLDYVYGQFKTTLSQLEQAISKAMANYSQVDEDVAAMYAGGLET